MSWVQINHVKAVSGDTVNVTTGSIDSTGADLLVVVVGLYNTTPQSGDLSDSKGNTWTMLTQRGTSGARVVIYYSRPTSVGTGHTFTFARGATATYPSICVVALSGSKVSPFDQENGGEGFGVTTQPTGSITPTEDGELILAGLCTGGAEGSTPTIDQGLTVIDTNLFTAGVNMGSDLAWKEQGIAAAINPAWSWTNSVEVVSAAVASFKAAPPEGLTAIGLFDSHLNPLAWFDESVV